MTDQPDFFSTHQPGPEQDPTDPKTGKTISRKKAFIMAGGAMAAGSALNDFMEDADTAEISLDTDGDGIGDAIISDENSDGVYEITGEAAAETSSEESPQQSWNPNTAPMASSGTVNDNMSFSEAFSAAREELGAGGVFAWQGQYYNTFYAEELSDDNQPLVEFEVTGEHSLDPLEEYDASPEPAGAESFAQDSQDTEPESSPDVMAADFDMDGMADAVYVDLNEDGSADAVYTDLNQDGQITEDEIVMIHDPDSLERPETASDGSMMSVDTNADGIDDILIADVDGDQVADAVGIDQNNDMQIEESEIFILDPEAMENAELAPEPIEYSGEVAMDMPEDVSEEVIDGMSDDVASLEDNFDEINEWS
jgi:hypothetical protein